MDNKMLLAVSAVIIIALAAIAVVIVTNSDEEIDIPTGEDTLLTVLGNANLDNDIDSYDVKVIEKIIAEEGMAKDHPYADANNDDVIDSKDIDLVKDMIAGKKTVIYYRNVDGEIASLHYPVTGSIIATYNKTLEACRTLGLSEQVVAVDDMIYQWPTYFPEFQNLPSVGNRMTPDKETILKIHPDAYLCGTKQWFGPDLESEVGTMGIDIIRLPTWEEGKVLSGMVTLGFVTQHEKEAQQYLEWAQGILDTVSDEVSKISDKDRPTVIVQDASKYLTTKKAGSGQYENSVTAGGYNIVKDIGPDESYYTELSMEWILQKDPEFIIFSQGSTAYQWDNAKLNEALNALGKEFALTSAYKEGNFHVINLEVFIGPSYPISVMYMAKWFYPDLFKDIDPEELLQEYIDTFCGIDMDVSKHGGFAI